MTHTHSVEVSQRIIHAALTGEPMVLPDCCLDDLVEIAKELMDDQYVLSSEFVE